MLGLRLYLLQRLSAVVMVPLVLVHVAVMVYATQGGLSAAEILGRTQGSVVWAAFYGLFVAAVAVHGAIGLRAIAFEWFALPARWLAVFTWVVGLGLAGNLLGACWQPGAGRDSHPIHIDVNPM